MPSKSSSKGKNLLVFVGSTARTALEYIELYNKLNNKSYRPALIYAHKLTDPKLIKVCKEHNVEVIEVDPDNPDDIIKKLQSHQDHIYSITPWGDRGVPLYQNVLPHVHNFNFPSNQALINTTDKVFMRRSAHKYNPRLTPKFTIVEDSSPTSRDKVISKVGFPAVVKPSGLASSLLVQVCFNDAELEIALNAVFKKIKKVYKEASGRGVPKVLIEQYMEGTVYSTDAYIDGNGAPTYTPLVTTKNGRSIGFEDFFEYQLSTPVDLPQKDIVEAQTVASDCIKAVGLTHSTAHIELMKTEHGWKLVELGPRIGGYRNDMYMLSFGINHMMNDFLNRAGNKPTIKAKPIAHSVVIQFYPSKEGRIQSLRGARSVKSLASYVKLVRNKKIGDMSYFAKNGGTNVMNLLLSNTDKQALIADIRRAEQTIKIKVS